MLCEKCLKNPFFHSFLYLGDTEDGHRIFYSKPSLNVEKQFREDSIPNYLSHLDDASKSSWIWIFDAGGLDKLEMPNPLVMRKFYKIIQERYKDVLLKIYMFDVNWKVSFLLSLIYPFVSKEARARLQECKTPLELLPAKIPSAIFQEICLRLEE